MSLSLNQNVIYKDEDDMKLDVVQVRLVKDAPILSDFRINSPEAAVKLLGEEMSQLDREYVCVINLWSDGTPINCSIVSVGSIDKSVVSCSNLFKTAILSNASSIIVLHNHPSSSLEPSDQDINITRRIMIGAKLMDIQMMDHIIVGAGNTEQYYSFREFDRMDYIERAVNRELNGIIYTTGSLDSVAEKSEEILER